MPVADESIEALSDVLKNLLDSEPDIPDDVLINPKQFIRQVATQEEDSSDLKRKRNAPANEVCDTLIAMFQGNLLFDPASNIFYLYEREAHGLWTGLSEAEMKSELFQRLDLLKESALPRGFGPNTINDQYTLLSQRLQNDEWNPYKNLILFRNGVFNTDTEEFEGFKREHLHQTVHCLTNTIPMPHANPSFRWLKVDSAQRLGTCATAACMDACCPNQL